MPFITGFLTFWSKGGWKIFLAIGVAIGVAVGIFFTAKYILDEFKTSAARQAQIIELQGQMQAAIDQSKEDADRIRNQNNDILLYVENMRNNVATIGTLRRQLDQIESSLTPNADPSTAKDELEAILNNQYACMERVSRGETNANCT